MKRILLFLVVLFAFVELSGQNNNSNDSVANIKRFNKKARNRQQDSLGLYVPNNSIYPELFGFGIFYSLNYERVIYHKHKDALNIRIGATYNPIFPYSHVYGYPLLINYQRYLVKSVSSELGLGMVYMHWYSFEPHNHNQSDYFLLAFNAGFRFLVAKHFLIKLDFTPAIFLEDRPYYGLFSYAGLGLGYSWGGMPNYMKSKSYHKINKDPNRIPRWKQFSD